MALRIDPNNIPTRCVDARAEAPRVDANDFRQFAALRRGAEANDPADAARGREAVREPVHQDDAREHAQRQLRRSDVRQRPGRHVPGHGRRPARRAADRRARAWARRHADPPAERRRRQRTPATGAGRRRPKPSRPNSRAIHRRDSCRMPTAAARELGVDPRSLIAQAALETGWGTFAAPMAGDSHNLFGIKAGANWNGATRSGKHRRVRRQASRRAIDAELPRLRVCRGKRRGLCPRDSRQPALRGRLNTGSDVQAFANALQRGGYATDPDYASKLAAVASRGAATHCRRCNRSSRTPPRR